jgi:hypothetical protein
MTSGSKKGTQIYFSFLSKVPANEPPLQVLQQGPYSEGGPLTGHFAYLSKTSSSRSPVKEPYPKVPFIETLAERCPTTTALLHSTIKVTGIPASPTHQVPLPVN